MDTASAAEVQSINLSSQVSMRVVKTAQDAMKQEGDAAIQLIQAAAEITKQTTGNNGLGGRVNMVA